MDIDTSGGKEMDRMIEIALNGSMMGGEGGGVVLKSTRHTSMRFAKL